MKLICLNVGLFEANNSKLKEFIESQQADILCLQEVTKGLDSETNQDFVSKPAIDQGSPRLSCEFFAPIWILDSFEKHNFHGKDIFRFEMGGKAEFGNYIRSNLPISKAENVFVQNHFTYVTDWSRWPEEDYRAFAVADLNINANQPLRVISYHGIWSKDKQGNPLTKPACEMIKAQALAVPYPSIICGDFNLFPDSESIKVFEPEYVNLCNQFEIKTTRPDNNELRNVERNVVDYVFVSKGIRVNHFEVPQSDASDHLPLVLDFELEP